MKYQPAHKNVYLWASPSSVTSVLRKQMHHLSAAYEYCLGISAPCSVSPINTQGMHK